MEDDFLRSIPSVSFTNEEIIKNATIIDDGIQENIPSNAPLTHAEIIKNATIIDEGIKLCPLCHNEVRLFFINLNEKVLMCENFECDYPFGYDEIIFVKENDNVQCDVEVFSIKSKQTTFGSPTATCSVISAGALSDIDRMNQVSECENDNRIETREYYKHKKDGKSNTKIRRKIEENPKILKEVAAIKKMNLDLEVSNSCIKNKKWIQNLMALQRSSGLSLLKPEEMSMFKQKKPDLGLGELKIDINTDSGQSMSLINIEISNKDLDKKNANT